jgi:hypothetical protein
VKRIHIAALFLCTLICAGCSSASQTSEGNRVAVDDSAIGRAFNTKMSGIQVEGKGLVTRILSDDPTEPRHQRFVVRLASGHTLLITHNIDIAPRVDGLREGDGISFNGEYLWNPEGGMVHWTHHDPKGRHVTGWLKHNGRTYQ